VHDLSRGIACAGHSAPVESLVAGDGAVFENRGGFPQENPSAVARDGVARDRAIGDEDAAVRAGTENPAPVGEFTCLGIALGALKRKAVETDLVRFQDGDDMRGRLAVAGGAGVQNRATRSGCALRETGFRSVKPAVEKRAGGQGNGFRVEPAGNPDFVSPVGRRFVERGGKSRTGVGPTASTSVSRRSRFHVEAVGRSSLGLNGERRQRKRQQTTGRFVEQARSDTVARGTKCASKRSLGTTIKHAISAHNADAKTVGPLKHRGTARINPSLMFQGTPRPSPTDLERPDRICAEKRFRPTEHQDWSAPGKKQEIFSPTRPFSR
jgi:hypothetical protein